MGICLDTEQNNEELETSGERTRPGSGPRTPADAEFPMQNTTHVKFEPPNVPVIFVLGGPGSGKVTHCDNLMQERRGAVHINMTDLLQQYAIGNDMQDFGKLSSRTVTEVLMLEMKMAPAARAYLVSGYPRSMRDVAEYSDKIQTISGVVLVSWRQRVLERQIEYGARLGHVVLSLARMELNNFYRNVMPVADYFDQTNMLIAVNGERNPEEVYKDFRAAVLQILGPLEDQTMNGVSAVGVGAGGIPGEIVGVEPATRPADRGLQEDIEVEALEPEPVPVAAVPAPVLPSTRRLANGTAGTVASLKPEVIRVRGASTPSPALWVVGGPGSNKAALCERAVSQRQGWTQFSLGQRLRGLADSGGGVASDGALARSAVTGGELAPSELVSRLVRAAVTDAARSGHGLVLDGYPRDLEQMELYEREFNVTPRMVLLDCSKLQLGRGRRDDSVAAFRRRLEVFRELSLPMLKNLDQQHRLVIVDGDTDSAEVQAEFTRVLLEEMEKAEAIALIPQPQPQQPQPPQQPEPQPQPQPPQYTQPQPQPPQYAQPLPQAYAPPDARAHARIPTTDSSKQLAHAAARVGALANGAVRNGQVLNGQLANGFAGINSNKIKPMVGAATLPTVSQLTHDEVRRLYEQSSGDVTLNTHM